MKQLIITFLLIFAIMPNIKAQVSAIQGPPCPVDGKFEYDDFEKKILEFYKKFECQLRQDILIKCYGSSDFEKCYIQLILDEYLKNDLNLKTFFKNNFDLFCYYQNYSDSQTPPAGDLLYIFLRWLLDPDKKKSFYDFNMNFNTTPYKIQYR